MALVPYLATALLGLGPKDFQLACKYSIACWKTYSIRCFELPGKVKGLTPEQYAREIILLTRGIAATTQSIADKAKRKQLDGEGDVSFTDWVGT